eukprot:scaffold259_cov252-Pinguiococcus_pyrenoidosus.AAC.22
MLRLSTLRRSSSRRSCAIWLSESSFVADGKEPREVCETRRAELVPPSLRRRGASCGPKCLYRLDSWGDASTSMPEHLNTGGAAATAAAGTVVQIIAFRFCVFHGRRDEAAGV